MYEALRLFPHGQVLELSWSPKAELVLLLVFLLSLPSPRGFPLTCVPMCLWGLSLPSMFVAFLALCWYESQGFVISFFFPNQKCFWLFDLQNTYFKACSWIFLYLILSLQLRELHWFCSSLPSQKTDISQKSYFQLWWQGSSVTPSIHNITKISSPNN